MEVTFGWEGDRIIGMGHATIRDVAREAAVSVASVSRALNGHDNVRAALRERVESAAARLGYVPHAGARNLSLACSGALGIVLPDLHGEFFSEVVRGMEREASSRGLQLLLSNMHSDPRSSAEVLRTMRGRVDGLVIMAPHLPPELIAQHRPATVPTVLINPAGDGSGLPALRVENAAAAGAMTGHLIQGGCRHIVHLAGPRGNAEANERRRGYGEAVAAAGLPARIIEGDFNEEAGTAAAAELLRDRRGADALFAANDMMAIGALVALRDAGVCVPGDLAVAGFDDVPLARLVTPRLTTVRVDIAGLGARAISRLAALIDGEVDCSTTWWRPELMIRQTTGSGSNNQNKRMEEQAS